MQIANTLGRAIVYYRHDSNTSRPQALSINTLDQQNVDTTSANVGVNQVNTGSRHRHLNGRIADATVFLSVALRAPGPRVCLRGHSRVQ
eukprot:4690239-Pyramimonas_sp.AAC.1